MNKLNTANSERTIAPHLARWARIMLLTSLSIATLATAGCGEADSNIRSINHGSGNDLVQAPLENPTSTGSSSTNTKMLFLIDISSYFEDSPVLPSTWLVNVEKKGNGTTYSEKTALLTVFPAPGFQFPLGALPPGTGDPLTYFDFGIAIDANTPDQEVIAVDFLPDGSMRSIWYRWYPGIPDPGYVQCNSETRHRVAQDILEIRIEIAKSGCQ